MKRLIATLFGAAVVLGAPQSAMAQAKTTAIYVGGGATLPQGDYGTYAKTGWMAVAGVLYNITDKVWIAGEGMYGINKHSDFAGDKTTLTGANASIGYSLGATDAKMQPYIDGGVGILNHKFTDATGFSDSESKGMFYGGAGLYFPMGKHGFWVEGRYVKRGDTAFIPVMAGVSIQF